MIKGILTVIALTLIFGALTFLILSIYDDYKEYKLLKEGCERERVCFCDNLKCTIKERCIYTYNNNLLVNDTCTNLYNKLCKIGEDAQAKEWVYLYCK